MWILRSSGLLHCMRKLRKALYSSNDDAKTDDYPAYQSACWDGGRPWAPPQKKKQQEKTPRDVSRCQNSGQSKLSHFEKAATMEFGKRLALSFWCIEIFSNFSKHVANVERVDVEIPTNQNSDQNKEMEYKYLLLLFFVYFFDQLN